MKFTGALLLLAASSATAFQVGFPIPSALTHSAAKASSSLVVRTPLRSTVEDETEVASVDLSTAKADLLETAQDLKDEFGVLLIDSAAQEKLRQAVEKLESVSEAPSSVYELVGDWTLLCSTASASLENGPLDKINGIDTSKIPFFNEGPIKEIRNTLNKSLKVQQVIKSDEMTGAIDKVNHVLQYMPPDTLSAFLNDLPDALKSLNINPLQVSQSQVTLVHKAEVESTIPFIKTKLSLSSIVLNVAGQSQVLDPAGADVVGINVPFGEFLNAGSFDTTYMDDQIRVSRSKTGIVDQLRVFVRSEMEPPVVEMVESVEETTMDTDSAEDAVIVEDSSESDSESDDVSPSDY